MEASELRIGNWVSNGEKIFTVDVNVLYDFATSEHYPIEPIVLSPEILEKAGFVELTGVKKMLWKFDGVAAVDTKKISQVFRYKESYSIHFFKDGRVYFNSTGTKIPFVHQLQNLYFALTGEELMIEDLNVERSVATKSNSSNSVD